METILGYKHPESHKECLMCGPEHESGFNLQFKKVAEHLVQATYHGCDQKQGFQGILHGGVACALLDAAMCNALFAEGIEGVTADMQIRFLAEIPLYKDLLIQGHFVKSRRNLHFLESAIWDGETCVAKATAKFMTRQS